MGSRFANVAYSLAELTTVVLCGSVVILPKFIQLLRGRTGKPSSGYNGHGSYGQSSDGPSVPGGNFPRPLISSLAAPWADLNGSVHSTVGSYIPLNERQVPNQARGDSTLDSDEPTKGGIIKTIQIETERFPRFE